MTLGRLVLFASVLGHGEGMRKRAALVNDFVQRAEQAHAQHAAADADVDADTEDQEEAQWLWRRRRTPAPPTPPPNENLAGHGYCCCKEKACTATSVSDNKKVAAVYSPNQGMCCKMKRRSCKHILQTFSGYRVVPPSEDYCDVSKPQDKVYVAAALKDWCASGVQDNKLCCPMHDANCQATRTCTGRYDTGCTIPEDDERGTPAPPPPNYTKGSAGHTIHTYCNFSGHVDHSDDPDNNTEMRHKIVEQIVDQLEGNSIDQMAKSMFSVYMCIRWAPTPEYASIADSEHRTEQLKEKAITQHYEDMTFVPLKCSENMHVYDNKGENATTFFEQFEAEMEAHKQWYIDEENGVMASRLNGVNDARAKRNHKLVLDRTKAFDLQHVKQKANCVDNQNKITVDTFKASTEELLNDCKAAKWWLTKLSDWLRSMPFSTFLTPEAELQANARPDQEEHFMLCFGKRVASQLHRRKDGDHLMTDQSSVGCHGFYDFPMAAKMVGRIVNLWRPPTCQLAAMELDFKVKILEMMADMNDRLFDALPSLILEEESGITNWDGKQLEPAGTVGVLTGMWKAIANRFNFFKTKAARLGALLGGAVVKWVVCPLNNITEQGELDELDSALGTEDHVARYYSKIANARHTGAKQLMPGEKCEGEVPGMPGARKCKLGDMRVDMPEPYKAERFLCPVVPLLPGKQQLEVFRQKENTCIMQMSLPQLRRHHWYYRGHSPTQLQYNVTENKPEEDFQAGMIIDYRSTPDAHHNIYRTFARIGLGCTQKEREVTPRWCGEPALKILNDGMAGRNLLTNLPLPRFDGVANNAGTQRFTSWFYRQIKGVEQFVRRTSTEWAGRAKTRYSKLQAKSFKEVEAADFLHSMTFQDHLGDHGGDSTGREYYERYAVTVPCNGFTPDREFELKYQWAEHGMQLARKAKKDWNNDNAILSSSTFHVELRGDAILNMRDESNAWLTYWAHMRAYSTSADQVPQWVKTSNPTMESLTGSLSPSLASKVSANDMRGFRATFDCGTRKDMHDRTKITTYGTFGDCVSRGAEDNKVLRSQNPESPFLENEIVVRMVITEFPACFKDIDLEKLQNANETENHVYSNFMEASNECLPLQPGELPEQLANGKKAGTFRAMLLGKGVPADTLEEVLIDPADLMAEW